MAQWSETDLREMLARRAGEFTVAPLPHDALVRKARRRQARNVVLASAALLTAIGLGGLSLGLLPSSNPGLDSHGPRSAGGVASPPASGELRLVDYSVGAATGDHPHAGAGPQITRHVLRRHADCMRSHGFDVPEPTAQPGGGWAIIVEHPAAHGLDFRSRNFRQAWFVECGPLGPPLSGDLVIGGPRAKLDRFIACMGGQGFDLPEPTEDTPGHYDIDEWQFDLTRTNIDTSTRKWNRALFVTCAPEDI